jgi:hypothetical protein
MLPPISSQAWLTWEWAFCSACRCKWAVGLKSRLPTAQALGRDAGLLCLLALDLVVVVSSTFQAYLYQRF